jgi:phage terminase large subunit-like protein
VCGLDLEAGDDWRDPSVWIKANPNLGVSIQPRYLEEAVREATGMPAAEADVRRLNFCEWTDKQTAYLPTAAWVTCRQPMTEAELQRHPSVAALDLGEADDMSAFAVVWRLAEERFHTKVWFWTCEAAEQRYSDRPYALWRRSGALTVTPGNVTDYVQIRNDVRTIATRLGVKRIAFDRRGALQLSQELLGDGFDMRDQGQGFFLSEGTKKLAALVAAGHLTHDGHAVLDWQAGNLSVVRGTRGDIRPVKTFGPDKIDGMVALIMALQHAVMPAAPQPPTSHVYERKPVLIL